MSFTYAAIVCALKNQRRIKKGAIISMAPSTGSGMQSLHQITNHPFGRRAIFRISTEERGDVFMCTEGVNNHDTSVVEVDAAKFLSLWQKEPNSHTPELLHGIPEKWKHDYKFHHAEAGFSGGIDDPVPLAEIGCNTHKKLTAVYRRKFLLFKRPIGYRKEQFNYVSFSNGITRTIWLLAYGAHYFPVECSTSEAPLLQQCAGLPGGEVKTIAQLLAPH